MDKVAFDVDSSACGCGSRLPHHRCCGLGLAVPPDGPLHPSLLARLVEAEQTGPDHLIEALCREVLTAAPGNTQALWALSRRRLAEGNNPAVAALVGRIVAGHPNDVRARQDLALRVMVGGDAAGAAMHADHALRLAPTDPQSHIVRAMVLTQALKPHEAAAHYRRALEIAAGGASGGRDPIVLANYALSLRMIGRLDDARALYREACMTAPGEFQLLLDWARLEEAARNFPAALDLLAQAEPLSPGHSDLRLLRAVIQGRQGNVQAALAILGEHCGPLGPDVLMEQSRLLDRAGRYAEAFVALDAGRAAGRRAGKPVYDDAAAIGLATRLWRFFTAKRLATLKPATSRMDQPLPVFILGFPRSGTTLVEQTLTATDAIAAGGELPLITEMINAMPRLLDSKLHYPEVLSELWLAEKADGLDVLREHYLRGARQLGILPKPALFTDKMPLNEMHLGLIGLVFPDAPLIHLVRHPLDVVLSVYSNTLTHGFNCSASLESAARHYVLMHELVGHYRSQMELRFLQVRYEDLVHAHEVQVRRILDFVGVPFAPAHLRFHENQRHAPTASYAQVKEPLYDRSVGRWRHYRTELEPVIAILRPVIEHLGYEL